jgi:CheY-like chemotaxis protein
MPDTAGAYRERRRRMRAKITLRAHLRGGIGTLEAFEDLGKTLNVSRSGVCVATPRGGYWVGQPLLVTCPYWNTPTGINTARKATVVRNLLMPDFRYALALKFDESEAGWPWRSSPFPNQVRVLGVESDSDMARAMTELLERDGYHVVFVRNATQALDVLKTETPDVLIAEVEGGEICGKDLCAIVKKCERLQHVPVILLTGSAMPSDYAESHQAGAVVCMKRPCEPERLQRTVHMVAPPPSAQSPYSGNFNVGPFVRLV